MLKRTGSFGSFWGCNERSEFASQFPLPGHAEKSRIELRQRVGAVAPASLTPVRLSELVSLVPLEGRRLRFAGLFPDHWRAGRLVVTGEG